MEMTMAELAKLLKERGGEFKLELRWVGTLGCYEARLVHARGATPDARGTGSTIKYAVEQVLECVS